MKAKGSEETIGLPTHVPNSNPHLHHPAVTLPHLRDLDEEFPGWWRGTQTPIDTPQTVRVAEIVGSASGSGWQFLPDWKPVEPTEPRFEQVLHSIRERGFDPAFDGSPIELIKFQGEYWVADGHRRVSAAAMLGIGYVRAEITVLEFTSPPQRKTRIENMDVTE